MLADRHSLNDLKDATEKKMASMYKDICEKKEFLCDMNVDVLSALLCRDDLRTPSENFVFKSVMQWIKYRKRERLDVGAKGIGAVRLGLMDSKDVIEELDTEEMKAIPEINMLLQEALIRNCWPSRSSALALEKGKPRSMNSVGEKVFKFEKKMASMYKDICEKKEFLSDMNVDVLSALLCRDDLRTPSEHFVFKSVMQWINYREGERMDVAAKVIGAVRLGLVDSKDVIEELDTEEMKAIPEINMLLQEALIRNCRPSRSSALALEKGKPRSMNSVGEKVFKFARKRCLS